MSTVQEMLCGLAKATRLETCPAELVEMVCKQPDIAQKTESTLEFWIQIVNEEESFKRSMVEREIIYKTCLHLLRTILTRDQANKSLREIEKEERRKAARKART